MTATLIRQKVFYQSGTVHCKADDACVLVSGGIMAEGIMKLTKQQADLQVECFSTLFTYARLLSEEQIRSGRICTQEDRDNQLFLNVDEDEIYLE